MFQKIRATSEIGDYLLSKVNPKVDNYGEETDPIIDERFHKIDPSIGNRGIKYLTANIETLLNKRVTPRLVSYIGLPSTVRCCCCCCYCCCCCCCVCCCHRCCCCCCCCCLSLSLSLSLCCCCCWLYVLSFVSLINFIVHDINILEVRI